MSAPEPGQDVALEGPGSVIGPYKLLQQIGEGGFGTVFMAEQEQPIRRRVALKILKPGMDTRQVVARFEAERQALALMDHPNIARVLDAGATAAGRPYFAMELVKGIPIQQYCDTQRLSTRERLALFIDVCRAVQHAHQKGIIHRDLKPSNILVGLHDGKAVPKVIDFGIAKALERKLTEKTLFTDFRQMIGTPAYMSPEQTEISGLDVDTRSDIYSLGVLLYELLTGALPFDLERLQKAGYGEILRIIREEEPAKPSTKVSTLAGTSSSVAACRRTEPAKLGALLRGELDWIVMKTLEKERARRYETADALASDVQRYLDDEPVLAGAPSRVYRARKFVRRHRVGVLTTAALVLLLGIGLAGTSVGLVRASHASARARKHTLDAARQFWLATRGADLLLNALTQDLPSVAGTRELHLRLLGVAKDYNERLGAEHDSGASEANRIRFTYWLLGRAYVELGDVRHAQEACDLHRKLVAIEVSEDPHSSQARLDSAVSLNLSASIARCKGDTASALEQDEQALQALGDEAAFDSYDWPIQRMIAWTHEEIALARRGQSDFKAAREHNTIAKEEYEKLMAAGHRLWLDVVDLGNANLELGSLAMEESADLAGAKQLLNKAQEIANQLLGEFPNASAVALLAVNTEIERGRLLSRQNKRDDALACYVRAQELAERLAAEDPHDPHLMFGLCTASMHILEHVLDVHLNLKSAENMSALALQATERLLQMGPGIAAHLGLRTQALLFADELLEAQGGSPARRETVLAECLAMAKSCEEGSSKDINAPVLLMHVHSRAGRLAEELGKQEEAAEHFRLRAECAGRALQMAPTRRGLLLNVASSWEISGQAALMAGRIAAAADDFEQALALGEQLRAAEPNNPGFAQSVARSHYHLGRCALSIDDLDDAREHFESSRSRYEALLDVEKHHVEAQRELADVYLDLTSLELLGHECEKARAHNERARELLEKQPSTPEVSGLLIGVEFNAGRIEVGVGRLDRARAAFQAALDRVVMLLEANPNRSAAFYLSREAEAYENLAHVSEGEEARKLTLKAIGLLRTLADGSSPSAYCLNQYAMLLLTCAPAELQDANAAVVLALRGVDLSKRQEPALLDTLALAYFGAGELQEAVDTQAAANALLNQGQSPRRKQFEERLANYKAALAAKNTTDTHEEGPR